MPGLFGAGRAGVFAGGVGGVQTFGVGCDGFGLMSGTVGN